jgi:hypothetical protein
MAKLGINMGEVFVDVIRKLPLRMNLRPKERWVTLEGEVRKTLGLRPGDVLWKARWLSIRRATGSGL